VNRLFSRFALMFASALARALVKEAAWLTVRAARRRMEARDRYVPARNIPARVSAVSDVTYD